MQELLQAKAIRKSPTGDKVVLVHHLASEDLSDVLDGLTDITYVSVREMSTLSHALGDAGTAYYIRITRGAYYDIRAKFRVVEELDTSSTPALAAQGIYAMGREFEEHPDLTFVELSVV